VTDLPAIEAHITEYRCHRRRCRRCGQATLAALPADDNDRILVKILS
jgi:hypothetical protein